MTNLGTLKKITEKELRELNEEYRSNTGLVK